MSLMSYLKVTLKMNKIRWSWCLWLRMLEKYDSYILISELIVTAPFYVFLCCFSAERTKDAAAVRSRYLVLHLCLQLAAFISRQRDGSQYEPYFHHWKSNEMMTRNEMVIFIKQTFSIFYKSFLGRWSRKCDTRPSKMKRFQYWANFQMDLGP